MVNILYTTVNILQVIDTTVNILLIKLKNATIVPSKVSPKEPQEESSKEVVDSKRIIFLKLVLN